MTEQVGYKNGNNDLDEFEVYDVSPCVTVDHQGVDKFKRRVEVSLPLPETHGHVDTSVVLLQWTDDDEIELQQHNIEIRDGVGHVEVDSFSGKMLARMKKGLTKDFHSSKDRVKKQISCRLGRMKYCQILIFVDTSEVNTLWVEVVSSDKVDDLLIKRKKDNPCLFEMNNSRSGVICLADRECVRIEVDGKFRFPPCYEGGYAVLTFIKNSMENHIRFPLEPNQSGSQDPFTYMNFKIGTKRKIAKLSSIHRYHFSAIYSDTVKEPIPSTNAAFFSEKSLRVLAETLPVNHIEPLGIQLGIKVNVINNFEAAGYSGFDLTFRILREWMLFNRPMSDFERLTHLSKALVELGMLNVASILKQVFKEKRELHRGDFRE
ncbi:hypothetical protein ACJMK2_011666 [Sinanodonta woodiana]|uniref:Death domain-containing protein n=1 Tax=Sinanodonta woodiana TaxID=1069815 RepID=A0ABD3V8U8_SINWO